MLFHNIHNRISDFQSLGTAQESFGALWGCPIAMQYRHTWGLECLVIGQCLRRFASMLFLENVNHLFGLYSCIPIAEEQSGA